MSAFLMLGRVLVLSAVIGTLAATVGCLNRAVSEPGNNNQTDPDTVTYPQSANDTVDLLFVVDNSAASSDLLGNLRTNALGLVETLRALPGGLPSLHLGVVSTDLGSGMFNVTYCEDVEGNAGRLVRGSCPGSQLTGVNWIVDAEPRGCEIQKNLDGICLSHSCVPQDCDHEPTTTFVEDPRTGCPRCRNYAGVELPDLFSCLVDLSVPGCGFTQPLEAMYQALGSGDSANAGFLREESILAVVLVTDRDDCSASDPRLFDNTQTDINSTLGPLSAFRCFEFGIFCDVNSRTHTGERHNCLPREDPNALLHPLSRYVELLERLKEPDQLVVSAIAGPVKPSESGIGYDVVVGLGEVQEPEVQFECTFGQYGATPGIRVFELVRAFNSETDVGMWAYGSACSEDYTPALIGLGSRVSLPPEYQCLPAPLAGCADPGVEYGTPHAPRSCAVNSQCLAECVVVDIRDPGTAQEIRNAVQPCLEVAPNGQLVMGNLDRALAYANGHPSARDVALPVVACWHIGYQPECPDSNYGELVIARREDPPPRTVAEVTCKTVPRDEHDCDDLTDNDQDCLVDLDDPCCANPINCVGP